MRKAIALGLGVAAAAALTAGLAPQAFGDAAPQSNDIVGVGSDTAQYGLDFLADGDVNGDAGWNTGNLARRVFSFDATGDANGTTTTNATVLLRAGTAPVPRPNGSGGGIAALLADTGAVHQINFVRASRLPSSTEQSSAQAAGFGGLHVYEFATDDLQVAVSTTTHAPASLTPAQLVNIYHGTYTTWSQVPGYSGAFGSSAIHPLIPQTGSGTRTTFLNDLQAANGGTAVTLAASVQTVEENNPAPIAADPDAIGPFSAGRNNLDNSGFFGAALKNTINLLPNTNGGYDDNRGLYVIVRDTDVASTTPWLAGSSKNWVQTLFSGNTSWIAKSGSKSLIQAAGLTPKYADLGDAHS
jgi:ABC-type phosphate transport system substrate-binding protein